MSRLRSRKAKAKHVHEHLRLTGQASQWEAHIEGVDSVMRSVMRAMAYRFNLCQADVDDIIQDSWIEMVKIDWPHPQIDRLSFARLVVSRNALNYVEKRETRRKHFTRLKENA